MVLLTLLLVGCSARKVAYNWADRLILSSLDGTFHFSGAQRAFLKGRLPGHLAWHRREELPRYATALGRFRDHVQGGGADRAEVVLLIKEAEGAVDRLARRIAPDAGEFLSMIPRSQVPAIEASLKEQADERFEDLHREGDDYIRQRLKPVKKAMKTWMGGSTEAQLARIAAFAKKNRPVRERRQASMRQNVTDFVAVLGQGQGAGPLAGMVQTWMTRQQIRETPAFQEAERQDGEAFITVTADVLGMLTPEQRQHLVRELTALHSDIVELAQNR